MTNMASQYFESLKSSWKKLLALGIFFIILGIIGLYMSVALTIVSILFFGVLLIIAGITHFGYFFSHLKSKSSFWEIIIGICYILGGCLIIYDPIISTIFLTAFLAGAFVVIGVTRIIMAFSNAIQGPIKIWSFIAGLAALLVSYIIFSSWPQSGAWFIGLFIAIELIMTGWSYVIFSLALRKLTKAN